MTGDGFGKYRSVVTARATAEEIRAVAQDGGTVTALLCDALDKGDIDGAVLTKRASQDWHAGQFVATTREEIISSAGSVYELSPSVFQLKDAVRENALENVAYVGLPCQVVAVRKMQLYPFGGRHVGDKIRYIIGIFCSENFHHEGLRDIAEGYGGVPLDQMSRMHLSKGKFMIEGEEGTREVGIKKAARYAQDGDHVCPDLTAEYADISVGSIGSEPGWNTVFVRTRRGEKLLSGAQADGVLEVKDISTVQPGPGLLQKLALAKKTMARETIDKRKSLGLFVTRDMYY
ncbi:Coenzyme F420 hydrogenase/dehydrogenase, beta subunit C-terminal domain [Methanocella arvoryzae]|uniref:Coenzyme F420-reducing hydrogenase, beta subunit n=1 Tax=Methanocella arvoryzae (strain DSM 22066 / NBRC 105507 / MRE50) TaxID=351160 RepID=Q0W2X9_METAR|nr:Coenzyme F420 hydrogenase/dehydrogenase, beta subunit C-terminal domain [Methanocella arvoryzae]CAJ37264.1 coenzyme F420-reducing hydrogenase, beta subunit [Methanocella arvoryzae MRE50]